MLPWNSTVTPHYGTVRAELERCNKTLAPLDMLIAIHALSVDAVLVTNDQAFYQMTGLSVEDWTV